MALIIDTIAPTLKSLSWVEGEERVIDVINDWHDFGYTQYAILVADIRDENSGVNGYPINISYSNRDTGDLVVLPNALFLTVT